MNEITTTIITTISTIIMQNLRLVTVDMVGTILRFAKPPVQQYLETAAKHGVKVEFRQLERSFLNHWGAMNTDLPHFGATSGMSSLVWWVSLVKGTFKDVLEDQFDEKTVAKIASELYSFYHSPRPYLVTDDGFESLQKIKEMKIKIGVISNFDNRLHDIIPAVGLTKFVDFVVTSEDAKHSKPEPGIFDFAAKKSKISGLEPHEVLHIGDDMDKDYFGARNVGWNSVLVDRWGGGYSLVEEEHVLQNITDVFKIDKF
eukprot:GFUD01039142.1.p1 GENE.GFUD01039142.1~~GFUD01039142.1.p1  ORF type:complete len:258 (-),score=84.99 GFUD01039142.1:59-832(-)